LNEAPVIPFIDYSRVAINFISLLNNAENIRNEYVYVSQAPR